MLLQKLAFIYLLLTMIACNPNVDGNTRQNKNSVAEKQKGIDSNTSIRSGKTDTFFARKQSIFKNWLIDTLKVLDTSIANFNYKAKGVRREAVLTSDSLGFSINSIYDIPFYAYINLELADTKKLLSLLREYNEYPQGQFALKFKTNSFFTASPVPKLPYDMTSDMEDIQVIEKNGKKVSRYDIVRGRIRDKHTTTLLESGSKKEEHINFFWKDRRLIKEKSN